MKSLTSLLCIVPLLLLTATGQTPQEDDTVSVAGIPSPLTWLDPPMNWTIRDGTFTITAGPKTDLFTDPRGEYVFDSSAKALFVPAEHFLLSAKVDVGFATDFDAGVLIVWAGQDSWAKLCFEYSPQKQPMVVSVVNNVVSDDCNHVPIDGRQVYFRIAGLGKGVYAFHYSRDGHRWHFVRYFSLKSSNEARVGFSSQSPTGKSCIASFSEIKYEKRLLTDLRTGN